MKKYDAIVIGAGHNGLVCACYLAQAGLSVHVLERRGIMGGAAVTEEFHPGFRNSTASYTVSLLNPKVIADLLALGPDATLSLLDEEPQVGGKVRIIRGIFAGSEGEVLRLHGPQKRIAVLLELLTHVGRTTAAVAGVLVESVEPDVQDPECCGGLSDSADDVHEDNL